MATVWFWGSKIVVSSRIYSEWSGLVGNSQSIQWAYWLEVSPNGRFWSGVLSWCNTSLVKTCLLQWSGYCCQKAEKTCSWELGWKVSPGNASPRCRPWCSIWNSRHWKDVAQSSQLTHYRASKSFPPRESIQPVQCVFMPSVLSMCQLLGPNFPFPIVTPDTSHSG